jgi:hypothetical protein
MFSMERAVKLFVWSCVVYHLRSGGRTARLPPKISELFGIDPNETEPERLLHSAMALYGSTSYTSLCDPGSDMHAIVVCGQKAVVIAFRGTVSMSNAKTDVHFGPIGLPGVPSDWQLKSQARCLPCAGTRPRVHRGFLDVLGPQAIGDKVVEKVGEHLASEGVDRNSVTVYCTGHSLGGAVAALFSRTHQA